MESITQDSSLKLHERPLYFWLKSFTSPGEIPIPPDDDDDDQDSSSDSDLLQTFVTSNALNYALEYIGITPPESPSSSSDLFSSLHLSTIFEDPDSSTSARSHPLPPHYSSTTSSRINSLNQIFLELQSFFHDRFSQLVTLKPPNTVHITAGCEGCGVKEYEKFLVLLLRAAIQIRKQETIGRIRSMKQDGVIEVVKYIASDSTPDLFFSVKPWGEFESLKDNKEEQKGIYDSLISLLRRLITERNEVVQAQLTTDYLAGHVNCDQQKRYNNDTSGDDATSSSIRAGNLRQLKEQLSEKSELLKECREELERARNRILDLEIEINELHHKHRAMKKARDEIDALREGNERAIRLETELTRLKSKLEESEIVYERVESLEIENREWRVKHSMLLDQISFLSFEKSNNCSRDLDTSFDQTYNGILDGLAESLKHFDDQAGDDQSFFNDDNDNLQEEALQLDKKNPTDDNHHNLSSSSTIIHQNSSAMEEDNLNLSSSKSISMDNLVASTPKSCLTTPTTLTLMKSQEVQVDVEEEDYMDQLNSTPQRTSVNKKRKIQSLRRNKMTTRIVVPVMDHDKQNDKEALNSSNNSSPAIHLYKIFTVPKKRGATRPRKFNKTTNNHPPRSSNPNLIVPNNGDDADEELSISPMGNLDLDSDLEVPKNDDEGDQEVYFHPGGDKPSPTTTTALFPVSSSSSGLLRRTLEFPFNPHNLAEEDDDPHSSYRNEMNYTTKPPLSTTSCTTSVSVNNNNINHNLAHSSDEGEDEGVTPPNLNNNHNNNLNPNPNQFTFGDYNIQLNLKNSIKQQNPTTTLITRTINNKPMIPPSGGGIGGGNNNNFEPIYATIADSSEEDGSIWYEYGCV